MICKLFYCETKHGNYCCTKCEFKDSCKNACLNKPKMCGSFLKPVNDVGFMKYVISEIERATIGINKCCELISRNALAVNKDFEAALESLQEVSVRVAEMNFELKRYLGVARK